MAAEIPTTASEAETLMLSSLNYSEGSGSISAAEQFVVAAKAWIILNPSKAIHGGRGGEEVHLNIEQVENMLRSAIEYIEAYNASGATKFLDFTDYLS